MTAVRAAGPRTWSTLRRLEAVPTWKVLAALVGAQWLVVVGTALVVRHNGWIYYQGGDQLWYYTTGWLLGHGTFPQPGVGYLWCVLLAPIALVAGPNVGNAYPAIIVLQFLFLLPVALLATYGIARRIGGRLFAYWAALLWVVVPLIGIKFTDAGYHQRYTEVLLPQGFGLTAMADLPTTVAALVSMYYCARLLHDDADRTLDGLAAGLAGGAAIAIKPATALVLFGPALAFLVARHWRGIALYAAGIAPAAITLAFVKWRGFGHVPLLQQNAMTERIAAGRQEVLGGGGALGQYLPFHGHQFLTQLDQLREHFWSVRVVEWLVIAGLIAVFLRSRRFGVLLLGWFAPIILIKTGSARADMEGGGLLRVLMPAYPAFVLMIASLPFLLPGVARRAASAAPAPRLASPRIRTTALVASLLAVAVIPLAAYAADSPLQQRTAAAAVLQAPPIPIEQPMGLVARRSGGSVHLTWHAQHAEGGRIFYHVFRRPASAEFLGCAGATAQRCQLQVTDLGATRRTSFDDRPPTGERDVYYVGVAANWLNDLSQGDVYELSRAASG